MTQPTDATEAAIDSCLARLDAYLEQEAPGLIVTDDITEACLQIISIVADEFPDLVQPLLLERISQRP